MAKPFSWSYSRYDTFNQCPLKYKLQYIDKLPTSGSPAMARGDKIHKSIAAYLQAPYHAPFPGGFDHHKGLIQELTAFDNKVVEQQWGFSRSWSQTGWFGDDVWVRVIADVGVLYDDMTGEVIDWKTGKHRETHDDQLEISAVAVMARMIPCTHVTARMVYLDSGTQEIAEFPRTDYDAIRAKWATKAAAIEHEQAWLPKPNDKCRLCDFSRSKGGPCRYG